MTNSQAWTRYSYNYNNPINYVDPSGHYPLCIQTPDGVDCFTIPNNSSYFTANRTLLLGGGRREGDVISSGLEVSDSMPAWQSDERGIPIPSSNKIKYPGVGLDGVKDNAFTEGKSGQAHSAWGLVPNSSVNIIGFSAGTESALMAATLRVQNGYGVNNVVLLGSSFYSQADTVGGPRLSFGEISYDAVGELEMNDWADYIAYLTLNDVNVLVVADSATPNQLAKDLNPPGSGKYNYWDYTDYPHSHLNTSRKLKEDVYAWME